MIFVVDAHRDDGKRFIVRGDEKLTAFIDLAYKLKVAVQRNGHFCVEVL
jgi:hypothetical protein